MAGSHANRRIFGTRSQPFFFGRPDAAVLQGLSLDLTPPADARARFLARHAELLAQL